MGRGKRGGNPGKRGGRGAGGGNEWARQGPVETGEMVNEKFMKYYSAQPLFPLTPDIPTDPTDPQSHMQRMLSYMRQPLPTTFRFTGSLNTAQDLREHLESVYVPLIAGIPTDVSFQKKRRTVEANPDADTQMVEAGEVVAALEERPAEEEVVASGSEVKDEDAVVKGPVKGGLQKIVWYPNSLGWQLNVGKQVIRKSPPYKKLQQFLVYETEVGNMSRQEAVSMIPPLLLDVQPHHYVLDMCAAPGSKTTQLLEALHTAPADHPSPHFTPTGLLIANDSDLKRAHLLVHQTTRIPSPSLMVTNLDASQFPQLRIRKLSKKGVEVGDRILFDRILADVPCSGDGTIRKNPEIWQKWSTPGGNGLHALQVRILNRAMSLLKPGGRLVYSTCTFNPIENEAVIASALNSNPDFSIVDASHLLPELQRFPGITSWTPAATQDTILYKTYEEFMEATEDKGKELRAKMQKSMWPPANVTELGLEKCLRLYPHLQDTGGFFVTVLEKKEPVVEEELEEEAAPELAPVPTEPGNAKRELSPESATVEEPPSKKLRESGEDEIVEEKPVTEGKPVVQIQSSKKVKAFDPTFKEMPYSYLKIDDAEVSNCFNFFQLDSSFPRDSLYVRNTTNEALRSIYLTTPLIKNIITHNDFSRIRLVFAGVKIFSRQGQDAALGGPACKWRVPNEGLGAVLPYVKMDTVLKVQLDECKPFFERHYPFLDSFDKPIRDRLEALPLGAALAEIQADHILRRNLIVPLWKSEKSMNLMLNKKEKTALSMRLFGADIQIPQEPSKKQPAAAKMDAEGGDVVEEPSEVQPEVDDEEATLNL